MPFYSVNNTTVFIKMIVSVKNVKNKYIFDTRVGNDLINLCT